MSFKITCKLWYDEEHNDLLFEVLNLNHTYPTKSRERLDTSFKTLSFSWSVEQSKYHPSEVKGD